MVNESFSGSATKTTLAQAFPALGNHPDPRHPAAVREHDLAHFFTGKRVLSSVQAPISPTCLPQCSHWLDIKGCRTKILPFPMILLKIALALFLIAWTVFGIWMLLKFNLLFGPHRDDPAETPGARSFGVTHVVSVWFGFFVLALYFLFR
jgi:hypothetical protein